MDNREASLFKDIFNCLDNNKLGQSIKALHTFINERPYMMYDDELDNVERDFRLMLDYMRRGFKDPQRTDIYKNLISRLYRFTSNLQISYRIKNVSFYTEAARRSANGSFSEDRIKSTLENFVTDVAMMSLESDSAKEEKSREIYRRHNDFIQALFCYIVVSTQWTSNESAFYEKLILSPTIDSIDAQVIVSAITLAAMNCMDTHKFSTLVNVYLKANDEKVRQKALVGFAFSLSAETKAYPELKKTVAAMLKKPGVAGEIADLQKQIIFCMNTEQDSDRIQKDIMPDLIKNNNLKITRFGITEKDEDPMADVFDPEASERAMEKMEESFMKMMNMQKAGSDIYFGGFSQMKRFAFFYSVANWFCPFYTEHPEISSTVNKLKATQLLNNILNNGPFCDSDKYSFTLAISTVISQLPDNIREMFNSQDMLGPTFSNEEQNQPAYIRRMILQDMYRFFRLFQQREQLVNPFDNHHFVFITDDVFDGTDISSLYPDLCHFMLKRKNGEALKCILSKYNDMNDSKCLLIHGIYELDYAKDAYSATKYLEALKELEPDNKRALALLARACFETEDYERAAECYETMHRNDPENSVTALNYCVALAKDKRYEDAVNLLYKLNFENQSSMDVVRVLAWTLMGLDRLEQAEKEYSKLLASNDTENGDWLNAGYCLWLTGDIAGAAERFRKFIELNKANKTENIADEFMKDSDVLSDHGISDIDMQLMSDLINAPE